MFEKVKTHGVARKWNYAPRYATSDGPVGIESAVSGDGGVLIRPGGGAFWIRNEDVDEFCATLKEAAKKVCGHCGGSGTV